MNYKVPAVLRLRLEEAIALKRSQVDAASPWAFVAFFRYLAMVQVCMYIQNIIQNLHFFHFKEYQFLLNYPTILFRFV